MSPNEDEELLIEDEKDLAEDALPPEPQQAIPIRLDKLFPWHRPRKQKVREHQWVGLARVFIDRLKTKGHLATQEIVLPDGSRFRLKPEIRYLTLPGVDYLDARLIGQMCLEQDCQLVSVGFLNEANKPTVLARAKVRETALIHGKYISDTSTTFPRDFESICEADGASLNELRRRAPFHIVNIDACGSMAPVRAEHAQRLIDSIYKLVELQLGRANHNWLFFLTVDVRSRDFDSETFERLCNAIKKNATENAEFSTQAIDFFKVGATTAEEAIEHAKNVDGRSFLNVFTLGFVKWMLHLAQEKQWSVKLKKSHCYSTREMEDQQPSMCSLAIEFVPPPPALRDPHGVTRQAPAAGGNPADPSIQILTLTKEIVDLDVTLNGNVHLSRTLNAATHALLTEIGYENDALLPLTDAEIEGYSPPPRRYPDLPNR